VLVIRTFALQASIRLIMYARIPVNFLSQICETENEPILHPSCWGSRMSAGARGDVTAMLSEIRAGSPDAKGRLIRAIYDELLQTARGLMRRERRGHTLEPGALVNEALLRLLSGEALPEISDGRNLRAAAAQAMRQVLVDHARRRNAGKREGQRARVPLDAVLATFDEQGLDVIDLHQALERLAQAHPRPAQVVTLRFFGGLTIPEIAATFGVSDTTIETDWRFARAWLRGQLAGPEQ
jgi:RNA polymerase sigma factor (TIGR02999 family)